MSTSSSPEKSVIIVGSGLAGLSAATTLISHSIPVTLLDRSPKPGGNSLKASSGINGAPTVYQPGPPLSDTGFYADTVKSAGEVFKSSITKEREGLVKTLTESSKGAVEWLVGKGVDLSVVAQLGGHGFPRTHRGAGKTPPGASIVFTLLGKLKESKGFEMEMGCEVVRVLKGEDGVVKGVEALCAGGEGGERVRREFLGAVVFASGGFGGDAEGMLARYRPDLKGFPSTNEARPGSQDLLTAVGARVVDMEFVQVHPTAFVDPQDRGNPVKFLAAELLRGEGGVLLHRGERFVDEMETRKVVTDMIVGLPREEEKVPKQWDVELVLDEGVYGNASSHIDFYLWKGLMRKITIKELGAKALATMKTYAAAVAGKQKDVFGRKSFGHWTLQDVNEDSVVYVGTVTPAVHFTMGGVIISEKAEVLDGEGKAIEGLWAAGEVTGGVHGENRLGGSSLLECVVFGRLAGEEAARYVSGG